jgi:drug/metabolite transporter (DMT)-like permease
MRRQPLISMLYALGAAALFGVSAPFAKVLLGDAEPIMLAALLYLGSGSGVLVFRLAQVGQRQANAEAPLSRGDLAWLVGAVLAGGIAAPIVQLFSLRSTSASTASLLLNFEGVATTLIAVVVFREAISRRTLTAMGCVTLASIVLSWEGSGAVGLSLGALGILAACSLWGIENNLMRNISAKDPLIIVMSKGLGAGSFSLILALLLGQKLPSLGTLIGALVLGSLSYGMSIVLFIRAMRGLGAARTSALFGVAPLVGVGLSFLLLREAPTAAFVVALPLMVVGALLLLNEQHGHWHLHEVLTHDHRHRHDDAHHDDHRHDTPINTAHAHPHQHEPRRHQHDHLPDTDHRHGHE